MCPNVYEFEIRGRSVRASRRWEADPDQPLARPYGGGGSNVGLPGASTAGRTIGGFSRRSREELRFFLDGLVWGDLGARPVFVTLTYPNDWRAVAPNNDACRRHLRGLRDRWRHRWGEPLTGVWVREFQRRGAPHYHWLARLPEAVSEGDYRLLCERTERSMSNVRKHGKWQGHRYAGVVRGEFGRWLRGAWALSVGSGSQAHVDHGVDVRSVFFGAGLSRYDAADERLYASVAKYLWLEEAKGTQKSVPEGFEPVGKWWDSTGPLRSEGTAGQFASEEAFMEFRRVGRAMKLKRAQGHGPGWRA